jgi:hypothetical protein
MNRLADGDIDLSLVNPVCPDHHHQPTGKALCSGNVISIIRGMVSVARMSALRSTTYEISLSIRQSQDCSGQD